MNCKTPSLTSSESETPRGPRDPSPFHEETKISINEDDRRWRHQFLTSTWIDGLASDDIANVFLRDFVVENWQNLRPRGIHSSSVWGSNGLVDWNREYFFSTKSHRGEVDENPNKTDDRSYSKTPQNRLNRHDFVARRLSWHEYVIQ